MSVAVGDRARRLAVLMFAPALIIALAVSAVEAWRVVRPDSRLFSTPVAYSLAEAIEHDDVQRAYEFIRAGQDANDLIPASHATLTGGRTVLVPPLVWAAALDSRQSVLMLLGFGARLDRPSGNTAQLTVGERAACVAVALGHSDMTQLLRTYMHEVPDERCPRIDHQAPLLAMLESSQ